MSSNSTLHFFRGTFNGPSLIPTTDVIAHKFLKVMTPRDQPKLKYNFISATTHCLPYRYIGDRELIIVMKVERVVNLNYVDCFDHANAFDNVHVSAHDLIDENTCVREARALHYIYTNRFDESLSGGWEVTSLPVGITTIFPAIITQYYNWEEKRKVYSIDIPFKLYEDIFLKFGKNIKFKGRYIEMFKEDDRGRILDTIIQFNSEE
ncbi:34737_t:CDS:2 [Gigaspora margarita]|uniref:34737_t:CDS:1 n=1 Tax=Gigaspora margarita TaxID=4874 RepID=A0ABN7UMD3_GIGMA|nr:34737_t:CDS:2 [Gigaspora margarita]